jgi:hypothetical protein
MRHGEDIKYSNNLSDVGFVRSNHLIDYFTIRKNPNINVPKRIIILNDSEKPYQSVSKLSRELNIKIESYNKDSINKIIKCIRQSLNDDILICADYDVLIMIIEKLIYKLYSKKIKLYWGDNIVNTLDNLNDYTSLWVLDDNSKTLKTYTLFDVNYNKQYLFFDIKHKKILEPSSSIQLTDDIYLFDRIFNFIDDLFK